MFSSDFFDELENEIMKHFKKHTDFSSTSRENFDFLFNPLTLELLKTLLTIFKYQIQMKKFQREEKNEDFMSFLIFILCNIMECGKSLSSHQRSLVMSPLKKHNLDQILSDENITKKDTNTVRDKINEKSIAINQYLNKIQSFEIIIQKFKKNFNRFLNTNSKPDRINIEIKSFASQIFEIILKERNEFYIKNFKNIFDFSTLFKNEKEKDFKNSKEFLEHLMSLMPNDIKEIESNNLAYTSINKKDNYINFDEAAKKPFIECLLNAFYINQNENELQNKIMNLIIKYSSQKEIFVNSLLRAEVLITGSEKIMYEKLIKNLKDLNNALINMKVEISS